MEIIIKANGACNKSIEVDMSFIEDISISPFNESELKRAVETAVLNALGVEGVRLDKSDTQYKKAVYDVHFNALMILNRRKVEKGEA